MEIYKNDYSKEEDELLWEIHNIRHELSEELKGEKIEEINRKYLNLYDSWKKEYKS